MSLKLSKDSLLIGGIVVLLLLLAYQQWMLMGLSATVAQQSKQIASLSGEGGNGGSTSSSTDINDIIREVIPTGIPEIYGPELGVSFDDPQNSINKLVALENRISFSGAELQRYVGIASRTACEYCCGATTLVTREGNPACGCAHSAAMRGLIKYLIQNHADWSDDRILAEANKWKALFFPQETVKKALAARGGNAGISDIPRQVGGC